MRGQNISIFFNQASLIDFLLLKCPLFKYMCMSDRMNLREVYAVLAKIHFFADSLFLNPIAAPILCLSTPFHMSTGGT